MFTKKRILLGSYYLPGIIVLIRFVFTMWTFVSNPLELRFPFLQVIPLVILLWSCFSHFKLYTDSVPVVSLLLPSILHFFVILAFVRVVMIVPFLPLIVPDFLYLVAKTVKANLFPFYMEGSGEDEFIDVDDIVSNAG